MSRRIEILRSPFVALVACFGFLVEPASAFRPARADATQATSADPCRFASDDAISKAFGRQLKSSKLVDVCQYKGAPPDIVVVRVKAGPEGTILRHTRTTTAQGLKGVEKVKTAAGEAYFDNKIPVFIGRVGDHEVQIETTIEPVSRDAMIAVGTRVMQILAGK